MPTKNVPKNKSEINQEIESASLLGSKTKKKKKKTKHNHINDTASRQNSPEVAMSCLAFISDSVATPPPPPPEYSPHFWHGATTRIRRHDGHEECEPSHVSMHPTWNPCPHCGSTRISSPPAYSARQIAHSAANFAFESDS